MRALRINGFNVTIPHKSAVMPLLDGVSPEAELAGAVNTVNRENDLLIGYNTDGAGLLSSLHEDLGFHPEGKTVLILGAGGAARGAMASLCRKGVSRVVVANRTIERGEALVEKFRGKFPDISFLLSSLEPGPLNELLQEADLLLNTASVGMKGSSFEGLSLAGMKKGASVYDMVYSPPETPLLSDAANCGLCCANGMGMLAAQGEAAFRIWTGIEPPKGLMRESLSAQMRDK
jgi:shikimate dehydrogenase